MTTGVSERTRVRALRPGETAWATLLPGALLVFAVVMLAGPSLGHLLFDPPAGEALWPPHLLSTEGHAEPVKRGRYVAALLGPVLMIAVVLLGARRPPRLRSSIARVLVAVGQGSLLAFVTAALLGQRNLLLPDVSPQWPIFSARTLVVGGLLALGLTAAIRSAALVAWVLEHARERPSLRAACLMAAIALPVPWLLTALQTDRAVGDLELMWWTMNDPFAILDGRTPLVDYHAFYAQLSPYVAAGALRAFGETVLTYSVAMTTLSLLALVAVYALLRRLVGGRSLFALGLFAPFAATGFLVAQTGIRPAPGALGNAILFAIWPMRYGGAYALAWLAGRHLDGAAPRRRVLLLLAAALVGLDNVEFGVAALVATVVAVLFGGGPWTRRTLARLALDLLGGVLGALALVSLVTLVRAGSLPRLDLLLEWPRVFGVLGLVALPMPELGFHLVLLATYVGAIAVAAVRRAQRDPGTLLTGMLAWSGTFGLLSGSYYLGRSDTLKLSALLSGWCLALVLLTIVVVQREVASPRRLPAPATLLVLFGLGIATCSLGELPAPWRQVERLRADSPPATYQPAARRFVAAATRPGERVTILMPLGHRVADQLGVVNVSPYPFIEAIVTRRQFDTMLGAARDEGAHALFLPAPMVGPAIVGAAHLDALAAAGYRLVRTDGTFMEWTDAP